MKVATRDDNSSEVESSLIVPVHEAMADVEPWRQQLDPFSGRGMMTHITVEYPFLPQSEIGTALRAELRSMFESEPGFTFELTSVRWFEERVVWLAPEPDVMFRHLTATVMERWPHLRPYGGPPGLVPPHLTVGVSEPLGRLQEAATALEPILPIACSAREVWLMTGHTAPGSWTIDARFPLAKPVHLDGMGS